MLWFALIIAVVVANLTVLALCRGAAQTDRVMQDALARPRDKQSVTGKPRPAAEPTPADSKVAAGLRVPTTTRQ